MKSFTLSGLEWKKRFSYLKSVPFDANDLRCHGAKFQVVKFMPNSSIKPHYHRKTCEIFYVQAGVGVIGFNGQKFSVKLGDFFLCEPGDVHEISNGGNEAFVILIFKTNDAGESDIFWL